MAEKTPFQRLPKTLVPVNYRICLTPNLTEFTFMGEVNISVEVKEETDIVVLNCADIKIISTIYISSDEKPTLVVKTTHDEENETVTFKLENPLTVGTGTLNISYEGVLSNNMKGFYRSKYKNLAGEERYAAATQFEATEARRAFPCWDEPAIKATFDIEIIAPKDLVVISNMPIKKQFVSEEMQKKDVTFQRTPLMSTYLVAFVVGEYDFVEDRDLNGTPVRVYTPVGKKEQGLFALQVAKQTLPFYAEYFGVPYTLPKIDLIGLADFSGGAMENWGLLTYREAALMIDPVNSSSAAKQRVSLIVGHELAHMWFGNLVTPEWWTNLWLKEGFATWIEYLCVDYCFPEFDIWTCFMSNDFTRAQSLDALKNSHPIEVPVGHPREVDEIFDDISYSKGSSVIRMLHGWLGDKDFRAGLHEYLEKHKYSNTTTEDLWEALAAASGQPVPKVMDTWTKQMGFPILKVSQVVDGNTHTITVQQEKFCADGASSDSTSMWLIPITISTKKSPDQAVLKELMHSKEVTFTVKDSGGWVKLNVGNVGFYRTCYSLEMLEALLPAVKDKTLSARDRLGLQNDIFAQARAGQIPVVDALKLAEAFSMETDFTVWSDLSSNLVTLSHVLQYTNMEAQFNNFLCKLYEPISRQMGWDCKEGESPLESMLRSLVLTRMGKAGDSQTLAEARNRLYTSTSTLNPDLRSAVYAILATHGDEKDFEKFMELFDAADLQEERIQIMRVLGFSKDPKLVMKTLNFAMTDKVRVQDKVTVIASCTTTKHGRDLTWQFVQDNWNTLQETYRGGFLFSRLVKSATEGFASEAKAQEVEKFFTTNPTPAVQRTIQRGLENIRLNEKQLKCEEQALQQFLAAY